LTRTKEVARRIAARKDRRGLDTPDRSWMKFRNCELCERPYCCNNYADHKVRVYKWQGYEVCAYCRFGAVKMLNQLLQMGVVKFTKAHKKKVKK
jgi:hypothetical protein